MTAQESYTTTLTHSTTTIITITIITRNRSRKILTIITRNRSRKNLLRCRSTGVGHQSVLIPGLQFPRIVYTRSQRPVARHWYPRWPPLPLRPSRRLLCICVFQERTRSSVTTVAPNTRHCANNTVPHRQDDLVGKKCDLKGVDNQASRRLAK